MTNLPASGYGKGHERPLIVVGIKFGTNSSSTSIFQIQYIDPSYQNVNEDSVVSVEDTVVAVD